MSNMNVGNFHIKPVAGVLDEALTVDDTEGGLQLDATVWTSATRYVLIQVQDNPVRVTFDGSAPTATNGFRYVANQIAEWSVPLARVAKFIREGAGDAVVHQQGLGD